MPKAKRQIIAIQVKLEVITSDKLRKIVFGLLKSTDAEVITWTIDFELHDRATPGAAFGAVVALEVEVKSKNNDLAELTANKGLNATQVEHLITRAAPAAAKAAVGGATPAIGRAIEGTLTAREA